MKTIEMKNIDGLSKLPCTCCGTYYSELKYRNGVLFCDDCRLDDRVQAFVDDHVKPTAEELKIEIKNFSILDIVRRGADHWRLLLA